MRTRVLSIAALLVCASASAPAAGPAKTPQVSAIEPFLATEAIGGASFSSDEKRVLFSSNRTGIYNVYAVPAAGGAAVPLTDSKTDSTYAVSFFPKDDRFLFTRDQGGNELNHLYVRLADGRDKDLTPSGNLQPSVVGWN